MPNVETEPAYVTERIEEVSNLGRKFLVSLALCAALLATIEGGVRVPDLFANGLTFGHQAFDRVSLHDMSLETCGAGTS